MNITVNGADRSVEPGSTVTSLLTELELGAGWVVVELDGEALQRSTFSEVTLREGSVVEIVRAVAGG